MSQESTRAVPPDVAFDLLSNPRRRFVLRRLQAADGGVSLSDLATELSAHESDVDPADVESTQRDRAYISLYQSHIPRLEAAGVVVHDEDGVVRPTDRLAGLAAYVVSPEGRLPWRTLYLVLCGGGLVLYALAHVAAPRGSEPVLFGVVILLTVAALTIAYYVVETRRRRSAAPIPVTRD